MHNFLLLYRTLRKCNAGISGSGTEAATSGDGKGPLVSTATLYTIVLGILLAIGLGYVGYRYADMIDLIGGPQPVLVMMGFVAGVSAFGLSLVKLINSMYISSDINLIIVMPFSATQIAGARVLGAADLPALLVWVLVLPISIGYGLQMGFDPVFTTSLIATAILLPLYILFFTALVVIVIMSLVKVFRSRDTLKVIGVILLFLLMLLYYGFTNNGSSVTTDVMQRLAAILEKASLAMPVLYFINHFAKSGNLFFFAAAILITAAAVVLFLLAARTLYLKGAMSMQDAGGSRHMKEENLSRAGHRRSLENTLILKEFNSVRRNPVYTLNGFILPFAWPLILLLILKSLLSTVVTLFQSADLLSDVPGAGAFMIIVSTLALMVFATSYAILASPLAVTALSREGKSFSIMKQLPISYRVQLKAKRDMALRLALLSSTGYLLIISIVFSIACRVNLLYLLAALAIQLPLVFLLVNLEFYAGLKSPNFEWDNEKDILKHRGGGFIVEMVLFFFVIPGALAGLVVVCLMDKLPISVCWGILGVLALVTIVAAAILHSRVLSYGVKRMQEL